MTRDLARDEPVAATPAGGRFGAAMTFLAVAGLAIAAYLLASRFLGEPPACGPVKGCETVAASEYATMFGVPVALFGVGFSVDPRGRLRHRGGDAPTDARCTRPTASGSPGSSRSHI